MTRAVLIAAPHSGSGKTTLTLGLLRALSRRGHAVRGAKSGPDYIDPRFHEAACGQTCFNLDAWAMTPNRLTALAHSGSADTLIIEGAMGLFDGAPSLDPAQDGKGASADLARLFDIPVILVVDAARMAQSIGATVAGFVAHDPRVRIAGVSDWHNRPCGANQELQHLSDDMGTFYELFLVQRRGVARDMAIYRNVGYPLSPQVDARTTKMEQMERTYADWDIQN